MSRRGESRVLGPTLIPSRAASGHAAWRVVVIDAEADQPDDRRRSRFFASEEEAEAYAVTWRRRLDALRNTTLEQAITAFGVHLDEKGTGGISSKETLRRLRAFFPKLEMTIARVTTEQAEELYTAFRGRVYNEGKPISVSYHRATLINARSLFKWAVKAGLVSANPFATVEGVGKRKRGKAQWTGDEAKKFYAYAIPLAEAGNKNALAVLMVLLMALRSADVCRRVVRDLDLEGTVLRVSEGKTDKSDRVRHVPEVLRPMLRGLVKGRPSFEPLFKTPYREDGHHTRRWLEQALDKMYADAGVPRIVPHALKSVSGSVLATTGELSERIADHLSHEDKSTTEGHYVAKGAVEDARTRRGLSVITGGKR